MCPFIKFDYLFFVLVLGSLAYVFFDFWRKSKAVSSLMETEAARRNAALEKGVLSFAPRMKFIHEGAEVVLLMTPGSRNAPPHTILKTALPQAPEWKLRIYRESGLTAVAKAFGRRDVQINNPGFDSAYYIRTNDEMRLRLFLTPGIQSEILSLAQADPALSVNKGNFELRVPYHFRDAQGLKQFIDTGLALIGKLNQIG